MASTANRLAANLGFLTVQQEPGGYFGGYLVTNAWGRPLEFRLSTPVQPNRVQQILYGQTLRAHLYADLIGKTLVDKTGTAVRLILTDQEPALDLRLRLEVPVAWLAGPDDHPAAALASRGAEALPAADGRGPVLCHPHYQGDVAAVRDILGPLADGALDLAEPFARIREAVAEARKMGVTGRA